jgi:tetratricopeptide (TPR) repeat protein
MCPVYAARSERAVTSFAPRFVARQGGYELELLPDQLDTHRFESLAAKGRAGLQAGAFEVARGTLQQALAYWRGPALADFAGWPFAQAESERLESLRMLVTEDLIETEFALGHHCELVPQLETLVKEHPLRERLWGHLMVALYRAERQAEALQAYRVVRQILNVELGIEPARALRNLQEQILGQQPELDWASAQRGASSPNRPAREAGFPTPSFLTDLGGPFVGRDRELERLGHAWEHVVAGDRQVVLIGGDPGVGKTRLAAEFARSVSGDGTRATVLLGRCDEDLRVPYQPFVEALRFFIDHSPSQHLSGLLGRLGGELGRLVPELNDQVPELPMPLRSEPDVEVHRLFDAVAGWLAAASRVTPLVLVLNDLQWAAKPTTLLLRHVARSAEPMRLLIIGIYSDTMYGREHPLAPVMADLRRHVRTEPLSLVGLSQGEVATFIDSASGLEGFGGNDLLARAIHTETQGNPFFIGQLLRHLSETRALLPHDTRWLAGHLVDELGIPEGVRELVRRRLVTMSPVARRVLNLAAVQGKEFDIAILQSAGDLDEDDVLDALEETVAARLVSEVPGAPTFYRFVHTLVRATLYDELSAPRRARMHERVARAIEDASPAPVSKHVPALAHHFTRAASSGPLTEKAVSYTTQAGHLALGQLAHAEAARYFRQALEMLELLEEYADAPGRLELLILLGVAERRAGDPNHRKTLLEAARVAMIHGDSAALAQAALENSRDVLYSTFGEVDSDRTVVLGSALEAVGEDDSATRARLLANLARELVPAGNRDRQAALSNSAVSMARRLADPAVLADVLVARHYTIAAPTTLAVRLAESDLLLSLDEAVNDPVVLTQARWLRFRLAIEAGDLDEADRCLALFGLLAAELGQPAFLWMEAYGRAGRELLAGRLEDAESIALNGYQIGRESGQLDARFAYVSPCFQIRLEMGEADAAAALLDEFMGDQPGHAIIASMRALVLCELDRPNDARRILEVFARDGFDTVPFDHAWLMTMTNLAAVSARLNHVRAARTIYPLLAPFADQLPLLAGVTNGTVALYLGLLARTLDQFDEAENHLASAVSTHTRINAPIWLARTRFELARLYVARQGSGDVDRARELLQQSLATARDLNLTALERLITQVHL